MNGTSPPGAFDATERRLPAGGIHGIKSIHMSVAKGSKHLGRKEVFQDLDTLQDKRGSIDSGPYSNNDDGPGGFGIGAEHHFNGRGNGSNGKAAGIHNGRHGLGNGLYSNGSPYHQNGVNGTSGYKTGQKSKYDGSDDFRNGRTPAANTTNGKSKVLNDSASALGFQLATGLYNRYQSTKSKPGSLIANRIGYEGNVDEQELPETALDAMDYTKRLRFEELKKTRLDAMCHWKKKDVRGIKKNAYIKEIQKKNNKILTKKPKDALEQLEVDTDRFPLLQCRKAIRKVLILLQMVCLKIISTKTFENISIFVIVANSAVMVVDDPAAEHPDPIFKQLDDLFNFLYSLEMVLKILGLGFILGEDAYLRDSWNILDFVIVVSSLIPYIQSAPEQDVISQEVGVRVETGGGSEISGLRAFRVLRPLRTITSIKGLRVLIMALLAAIPLLRDTLMILLFFFIVFSIGCLQLLAGSLK